MLTIHRDTLTRALTLASKVAPRKSTFPAINGAVLITDTTVQATDLDRWLSVSHAGVSDAPVRVLAPIKDLLRVVKGIKADRVCLSLDAHTLIVAGGGINAKVPTVDVDDYPKHPDAGASTGRIALSSDDARDVCARVAPFCSTDETRYVLNGVQIESTDKGAVFSATDGRRLANLALECLREGAPGNSIVPRGTWDVIGATIGKKGGGTVLFVFDATYVRVEHGNVTLLSRKIDGRFPDYRQVIPGESSYAAKGAITAQCDRVSLAMALAGARPFASVKVSVNGALALSCQDADHGEYDTSVPCQHTGADLRIGFHPEYLAEAVDAIRGDVCMALSDPLSPMLLTDGAYRHVIMPMRI